MSREQDTLERLAQAIDLAARSEVAELVKEARAQARAKARAVLAQAISERLLELADGELRDGSSPPEGASASEEQDTGPAPSPSSEHEAARPSGHGCYVYGVVGADARLAGGVRGIDERHEVTLVRGESIAAVTSAVCLEEFGEQALEGHLDDLSWLESHARRHEQVLERVREQTTLVPMRLCTIYSDERAVREMLAREHAFLAEALDRLAGRTEWGVKVYLLCEPSIDEPADDLSEAQRPSPERAAGGGQGVGASYLRARREQSQRRERAQVAVQERCERIHCELAQAAVEAKLNPIQPSELSGREEPMVLNGVYLVEDAAMDEFVAVLDGLQADLAEDRFGLELSGPWSPYNFVNSPTEIGR